ncbi:hypothetical protein COJE103337_05155 [Corynebacterium jeikeium]|nr:hypothetical protein CJEIK_00870 [Corynebacterium jeikeium]SUY81975.1 Uncharacterised protein [Corynebacterium jeikeium]
MLTTDTGYIGLPSVSDIVYGELLVVGARNAFTLHNRCCVHACEKGAGTKFRSRPLWLSKPGA